MKEIPLTKGYVALVDDEDYDDLMRWKWSAKEAKNTVYAMRKYRKDGKQITITMHRQLMGAPKGMEVDHIDRDGLNNQRSNLRLATHRQNAYNATPQKNKYGYRGICLHKPSGLYQAQITAKGRFISLGYHKTPEDAARAYDAAAREHHGEFATLNFPEAVIPVGY